MLFCSTVHSQVTTEISDVVMVSMLDEMVPAAEPDIIDHANTDADTNDGGNRYGGVDVVIDEFEATYAALVSSFVFIFISEMGDKTFIYLMMSAQNLSALKLLLTSIIALGGMHILSTAAGGAIHSFISLFWLKVSSIVLFTFFGLYFIYEGLTEEEEPDEYHKLEDLKSELILDNNSNTAGEELSNGHSESNTCWESIKACVSSYPYVTVFFTIIIAEMGDMSQISAVVLASQYGFTTVAIGGVAGHFLACLIAIACGKLIMQCISERMVSVVGGL